MILAHAGVLTQPEGLKRPEDVISRKVYAGTGAEAL